MKNSGNCYFGDRSAKSNFERRGFAQKREKDLTHLLAGVELTTLRYGLTIKTSVINSLVPTIDEFCQKSSGQMELPEIVSL